MWRESLDDDDDDGDDDDGDDDGDGRYLCLLMELYHLPRKNIPNARVEPYLQ